MNNLHEEQEAMRLRMADYDETVAETNETKELMRKSDAGELKCPKCHINPSTFSLRSYVIRTCKACYSIKARLKKYGISLTEYTKMLSDQSYRCAVCGDLFSPERAPHVEHCHELNHVRGLVCANCNALLGFCKENVKTLKNAITYLQQNITDRKWWVTKE
jgi:hypothetical protein